MELMDGFGPRQVSLIRQGVAFDLEPDASAPKAFVKSVNDCDYRETWIDGVDFFITLGQNTLSTPQCLAASLITEPRERAN